MKKNGLAFAAGLLFGAGLLLGGMTLPERIVGFLDLASGQWDPTLAFVMVGALLTYAPLRLFILRKPTPKFANRFSQPGRKTLDAPLVLGAVLFGAGWGLAGFCPAPALVAAGAAAPSAIIFSAAMVGSMMIYGWLTAASRRPQPANSPRSGPAHRIGKTWQAQ